jgi:hypothetical protein
MQAKHILQFSNNHTVIFEKGGGKVYVEIKSGEQKLASASGELNDYKRMFDMIVGDIPYDEKPSPNKAGTSSAGQQSSAKPFTANPSKTATEASKK